MIVDKILLALQSWPLPIAIVLIISMLIFKKQISTLILNIKKADRHGIETHGPQGLERSAVQASVGATEESGQEDLTRLLDSAVVRAKEALIKEDLKNRGPSDEKQKNEVLLRHLAKSQLSLEFEKIFSRIYASQIMVLETLNTSVFGETAEDLKLAYDDAVLREPRLADYSYDKYLKFLEAFDLIKKENDHYLITPYGREFLTYIVVEGKSKYDRPY